MNKQLKYMFIGAHPDDVEFSCGGTMARLIGEGHEVYIVLMTGGGSSPNCTERERRSEQMKSVRRAKITDIIMLDYEDGRLEANNNTVKEISDILESYNPDFVFTHYPDDSHQDHRAVAQMVKSAARRKYNLVYYNSYSSMNFEPSMFVDITSHIGTKAEMLRCFDSQITKYQRRGIDFIKKSLLINELYGYECHTAYAEGFKIENYMI